MSPGWSTVLRTQPANCRRCIASSQPGSKLHRSFPLLLRSLGGKQEGAIVLPKTTSFSLREMPLPARLALTSACFVCCCTIVAVGIGQTHFASFAALFLLPVIVAGCCFKHWGAFACVAAVLLTLAVLNTFITGSLSWPRSLLFGFVFGGIGYLIAGLLVSVLTHALELADLGRLQAQQTEERQQQLHRVRNQFLLNVSHELRTPLTELRGYLELLHEYQGYLDAAMQKRFLEQALHGCEELEQLVRSVLDAAQTTEGIMPPHSETLVVDEVFQDVLSEVNPCIREAYAIHLDCPKAFTVWADRQYTCHVLRHLLSNAFKYAARQTTIALRATLCDQEKHDTACMVRLSIEDAGDSSG